MTLDSEKDARDLHTQIVESARRRNAKDKDIPDPAEFERFMLVIEELGGVAARAAKEGISPMMVGRSLLFYAKCVGVAAGAEVKE